tara:strand:+ start:1709 stop:2170 length:462 start_codon:yes stop_codon:yes gene_type:complete
MARITVEDCIDKFPSRFELVMVASQRARKLFSGEEPKIEKDNDKNTVIALREIAAECISVDDMKENLITEYQTVTISDEEDQQSETDLDNEAGDENTDESIKSKEVADTKAVEIEKEISELTAAEDSEFVENNYEIENNNESSQETPNNDDNE